MSIVSLKNQVSNVTILKRSFHHHRSFLFEIFLCYSQPYNLFYGAAASVFYDLLRFFKIHVKHLKTVIFPVD